MTFASSLSYVNKRFGNSDQGWLPKTNESRPLPRNLVSASGCFFSAVFSVVLQPPKSLVKRRKQNTPVGVLAFFEQRG